MFRSLGIALILACACPAQDKEQLNGNFNLDDLRPVIQDIQKRGHAIAADDDDKEMIQALKEDADKLGASLDKPNLDKTSITVLLYYRAKARALINVKKRHDSQPID